MAAELAREIYDTPSTLLKFPYLGRPGRKPGTRELVLSPLPYIVVYQITGEVIHITRHPKKEVMGRNHLFVPEAWVSWLP